jgi:WD40 repeat protein
MKDPVTQFQDNQYYDSIYSISISPSGRYVFAASENSRLKVFDLLGDVDPLTMIDVGLLQNDGLVKSIDISADGYAIGMALGSKGNHKDITVIM